MCAILALIIYLTLGARTFWNVLFLQVLGQLYVISLFVTLCVLLLNSLVEIY